MDDKRLSSAVSGRALETEPPRSHGAGRARQAEIGAVGGEAGASASGIRPLARHLRRGATWSVGGAVFSRAIGIAASVATARILGREHFGELGVVQSTVLMFEVVANFALGMAATKFVAQHRARDPDRAGRFIALSTVVAAVTGVLAASTLWLAAPTLAERTLASPDMAGALRVAALLLFFGAVAGAQRGALAGFEAYRGIAQTTVAAALLNLPIAIIGAWFWGVKGTLIGTAAAAAVSAALNGVFVRRAAAQAGVRISLSGIRQEARVLVLFSVPAVLTALLVAPVNWACSTIFVNQPGGYSEIGLWSAANQWRTAILLIPQSVGAVALPMLTALIGARNTDGYRRAVSLNLAVTFASAASVAIPLALGARYVMHGYGAEFVAGAPVLWSVCLVAVIIAVANVVGYSIISEGRMWVSFALNVLWAAALLSCAWAFRSHGARGLAQAHVVAHAGHACASMLYAWLRMRKGPSTRMGAGGLPCP